MKRGKRTVFQPTAGSRRDRDESLPTSAPPGNLEVPRLVLGPLQTPAPAPCAYSKPSRPVPVTPHTNDVLRCAVLGCLADLVLWITPPDGCSTPWIAVAAVAAGSERLRSVAPHLFKQVNMGRGTSWIAGRATSAVACRVLDLACGAVTGMSIHYELGDTHRTLTTVSKTQQPRSLHVSLHPSQQVETHAVAEVLQASKGTLRRATLSCPESVRLLFAINSCTLLESLDWKIPTKQRCRHILPMLNSATLRELTLRGVDRDTDLATIPAALPNLRALSIHHLLHYRIVRHRDHYFSSAGNWDELWGHTLHLLLLRGLEKLEIGNALASDLRALDAALTISPQPQLLLQAFTLVPLNPHKRNDALLRRLASRAPLLKELTLRYSQKNNVLAEFKNCTALTLKEPYDSDQEIKADVRLASLLAAMPQLRWLHVMNPTPLTFNPAYYAAHTGALGHQLRVLRIDGYVRDRDKVMGLFPHLKSLNSF